MERRKGWEREEEDYGVSESVGDEEWRDKERGC
jgi:hypothetical protein